MRDIGGGVKNYTLKSEDNKELVRWGDVESKKGAVSELRDVKKPVYAKERATRKARKEMKNERYT